MKRLLATLVACFGILAFLSAQNEQKEINEIKRNLDFLYATGTSTKSAEEARENALDLLTLEIEQWLKENGKTDYSGYIAKSKQNTAEIKTQRGSLNRAFVYVKKSDILPYSSEEAVMVVGSRKEEKTAHPADTTSVVVTIPVAPVSSQEVVPQQSAEIESVTQQALLQPTFEPSAAEKKMLLVRDLSEINKYIADGSKDGTVGSYGKYDASTRLFGMSYFYVFDRDKVLAVLRKSGDSLINLSTGSEDTIANYGRCGVVWFQLKEK